MTPKTAGTTVSGKAYQYMTSVEDTEDQDITNPIPRIPTGTKKPGSRQIGTAGDEVVTGRERV